MRAEDFLHQALGGNQNVATLTFFALTELLDAYAKPLQAENEKLKKELASHRACDSCKEPMIPRTTCDRCQRLWES